MVMAVTNAVDVAAENARLKAELASARAELTGAKLLIEQLRAQLAVLRRMQFGRSSEKLDAQIMQLELMLEDLEECEAERAVAESAAPSRGADPPPWPMTTRSRSGRRRWPEAA